MPTGEVRIRRAARTDAESIWRVHVAAIEESCSSRYSPDEIAAWTGRLSPDTYEGVLRSKAMYVAQKDDEVIGFGQLDVTNGEVEAVYVRPEYGGEGVGTKLLSTLEQVARECGVKRLCLDSSLNAVGFYEHAGYAVKSQTTHPMGNVALTCVRMEKQIAAV